LYYLINSFALLSQNDLLKITTMHHAFEFVKVQILLSVLGTLCVYERSKPA